VRRSSTRDLGGSLSPRDADVWRAMARGLTNAEIAGKLFVSESTVKTHVARVLSNSGSGTGCKPSSRRTRRAWSGPVRESAPADGDADLTS
jgi:FixJ family two-component response regulator